MESSDKWFILSFRDDDLLSLCGRWTGEALSTCVENNPEVYLSNTSFICETLPLGIVVRNRVVSEYHLIVPYGGWVDCIAYGFCAPPVGSEGFLLRALLSHNNSLHYIYYIYHGCFFTICSLHLLPIVLQNKMLYTVGSGFVCNADGHLFISRSSWYWSFVSVVWHKIINVLKVKKDAINYSWSKQTDARNIDS